MSRNKYEKNNRKNQIVKIVCDSESARCSCFMFSILIRNSLQTRFSNSVWNKICRTVFMHPTLLHFFLLCSISFHTHTLARHEKKTVEMCLPHWNCDGKKTESEKNETSTKRKAKVCVCCASVFVWNETQCGCVSVILSASILFFRHFFLCWEQLHRPSELVMHETRASVHVFRRRNRIHRIDLVAQVMEICKDKTPTPNV